MGCNCNNGCNGMLATMQTGDTFTPRMELKDGDVVIQLPEGCDIVVGFYDNKRTLLLSCGTKDGRIVYDGGVYSVKVSHDESIAMKGKVFIEITITAKNGEDVHHGDRIPVIGFEPRRNNEIV